MRISLRVPREMTRAQEITFPAELRCFTAFDTSCIIGRYYRRDYRLFLKFQPLRMLFFADFRCQRALRRAEVKNATARSTPYAKKARAFIFPCAILTTTRSGRRTTLVTIHYANFTPAPALSSPPELCYCLAYV